ncbi:general transcription factor IIH subunit 3 [Brachionus plicatilis]|uniref:General transcription factor IIH subunit 3 n=1 Tax=Brachionus plicatilis TaxID=10195 RepID=A0A3M7S9H2_BRAPC|nr:general transcription factor IIH subunit 3 [Brachionus plicatilis]
MNNEKNLLIVILDTNPIWWGLQNSGSIQQEDQVPIHDNITFSDCLSGVMGFINAYKTMNQNNSVCLIAAHNTRAEYLYPAKSKLADNNQTPWERYEQISDIYESVKEGLKNLSQQHLENLSDAKEVKNKDNLSNDSMISSAMGLGLCFINRIQRKYIFAESVKYRFVVIKASDDSSNQYMSFMNMIFSAEKSNIIIDSCALLHDSSLLQQASNLTNGVYFRVPQLNGLLSYLLWLYLPDEQTRNMLVYPPKTDVDYRAACFCHHKLIDVGYVCSVCLSVFCTFTPICTTCNCNFRFDVNMLKKANSLKQGLMVNKLQYASKSKSDPINGSNKNLDSMDTGDINLNNSIEMIE